MHTSRTGSLLTVSSTHDGYVALPSCCADEEGKGCSSPRGSPSVNAKASTHHSRSCICAFFILLHQVIVALIRLFCMKSQTSSTVDGEALLSVQYHRKNHVSITASEQVAPNVLINENSVKKNGDDKFNNSCSDDDGHTPKTSRTQVTVYEVGSFHSKSQIIASDGREELNEMKLMVSESRRQLQEVKEDMVTIRDDIQTSKKLFQEVERGIEEYKQETANRDPWSIFEYHAGTQCFHLSASKRLLKLEEMYKDHIVFLEEMKYHFKWKHGIHL